MTSTQSKAIEILQRIVPWAIEKNSSKPIYRANHKGVRGRIGIVGGARDYAGAPYFASISSMRLGADLAYVICSSSASNAIKSYSPELIVTPLLDCPSDIEFADETSCLLDRLHALIIGPGLGRERHLINRAKKLIKGAKDRMLPLVLDADGLILVTEDPSLVRSYPKALLTPNRIELQRLANSLPNASKLDLRDASLSEIKELVKRCSEELQVSILAKGSVDIIHSYPEGLQLCTDSALGSNRRCGGQGDILSGLAGVYLHWIQQANSDSNGEKVDEPIVWAAYLAALTTRKTNELAFRDRRHGMLASDMIDKLHIALDLLLNDGLVTQNDNLQSVNISYSGMLSRDEISRYTRQMIMEEFGPERQMKLRQASALIIGAGGLGCPSSIYLAAGGIGRIGIVDDDRVEVSNLHRQILHNLAKVGMLKTDSIRESILSINPNVRVDTHSVRLTRFNAVKLIQDYDFVIDATDNIVSRYMISDACVVAKKPLISGAALKMDGQLTVYNYDSETPCFRCLFPEPPPNAAVGSCADNGVLGVLPGIIGVHQALEGLKLGAGIRPAYAGKMLLFDGQLGLFRHITLSKRKSNCEACGLDSKLDQSLIDYEEFCAGSVCKLNNTHQQSGPGNSNLNHDERITVQEYRDIMLSGEPHVLIDVRPTSHSDVSRFSHALQIPLVDFMMKPEESRNMIQDQLRAKGTNQVYVVCRRGIASQRGLRVVQELFKGDKLIVKDIIGGMTSWSKQIDPSRFACL